MMYQCRVRRNRFRNNCEEHKTGLVVRKKKYIGKERLKKKKEKGRKKPDKNECRRELQSTDFLTA